MEKPLPLHAEDLVVEIGDGKRIGVVERTNGDVDTHLPYPGRSEPAPISKDPGIAKKVFTKFLKDGVAPPGHVLVRWYQRATLTLILEPRLKLLDRSLLIGDVVKRPNHDAMSGVIINTFTKCTLQPLSDVQLVNHGNKRLKGLVPLESQSPSIRLDSGRSSPLIDIPASEVKYDELVNEEDLVIYKQCLGRIEEMTMNIVIRLADNSVVEIPDEVAEPLESTLDLLSVGDIVSAKKGALRTGRWVYGQYNPNTPPIGTVVARKIRTAEMTWLQNRIGGRSEDGEPPIVLDSEDMAADDFRIYDRSRYSQCRDSSASESADKKCTTSFSEIDIGLGRRVRFKDLSGACVKYDGSTHHGKLHRIDRKDSLGYDLNVFEVVNYHTDVTVQWQDLTITHEPSVSLIPDSIIDDDHAAWPGEIAHTLDFVPVEGQQQMVEPRKIGVVQTVDATQRMARLKWCPDGQLQYFQDIGEDHMEYKSLLIAMVGRAGAEEEELSLYDIECPGSMNVRRGDLVLTMSDTETFPNCANVSSPGSMDIDWVGEIVDTCLDGSLKIRLGASQDAREITISRELIRIAVRSDGTDQGDEWDDGDEQSGPELNSNGSEYSSEDYDYSSNEDELDVRYEDENGMALDEDEVENEDWESDVSEDYMQDVEMTDAPVETPLTSQSVTPPNTTNQEVDPAQTTEAASSHPEQYLILEGDAPSGHYYAGQVTTENSTHMKRVAKEHKILRSEGALPPGVYVRSYEARLGLLRVLFIGPADTPYENAPFIVDFFLGRSFPSNPPEAFFHSWTAENGLGGVGKVNPNLYEDGKICLSLLGTWDGDKGEGWSPTKSTLLQAIVSILGLVLVREPYFNEAGYEPLAGLESSRRPSALYNERTFLRSNGFIIKPLAWLQTPNGTHGSGVEGLEDVVRWLYLDETGQQLLQKKIRDVEGVLLRSEEGDAEPNGITCMSKGACIPLKRVLARLKELL